MRYVVDISRAPDDHVHGAVRANGERRAVAFSGWLELTRLLQPDLRSPGSLGGTAEAADLPDGSGRGDLHRRRGAGVLRRHVHGGRA